MLSKTVSLTSRFATLLQISPDNVDELEHVWSCSSGDMRRRPVAVGRSASAGTSIPWKRGTPNFGGPLVTSGGLVFNGAAMDDYRRAFDAETGEEV